jgi:hypothetical protein
LSNHALASRETGSSSATGDSRTRREQRRSFCSPRLLQRLASAAREAYLKPMHWTKDGAGWICRVPPGAVFTLKIQPKGDGRWTWEVFPRDRDRTIALGVVSSLGAAKATSENFVNRSGKV